MAQDAVEIVNQALSRLGAGSISNFDEESKEARTAKLVYETTVRAILRAAYWNFARAVGPLSVVKAAPGTPEAGDANPVGWSDAYPAPPWLYAYTFPANAVMVRMVVSQNYQNGATYFSTGVGGMVRPAAFVVASDVGPDLQDRNVVLTNLPQAMCVYTKFIGGVSLWDSLFTEAVIDGLATQMAQPLTGKRLLRDQCARAAQASILEARVRDGNEGFTPDNNIDAEWIRARVGEETPVIPSGSMYLYPYAMPGFLSVFAGG